MRATHCLKVHDGRYEVVSTYFDGQRSECVISEISMDGRPAYESLKLLAERVREKAPYRPDTNEFVFVRDGDLEYLKDEIERRLG